MAEDAKEPEKRETAFKYDSLARAVKETLIQKAMAEDTETHIRMTDHQLRTHKNQAGELGSNIRVFGNVAVEITHQQNDPKVEIRGDTDMAFTEEFLRELVRRNALGKTKSYA